MAAMISSKQPMINNNKHQLHLTKLIIIIKIIKINLKHNNNKLNKQTLVQMMLLVQNNKLLNKY